MKSSFYVLRTEAIQTLRQTKTLMLLFFITFLYESILSPMSALCEETQLSVQTFEPFILICNGSANMILIPLVYIFLISGFPCCSRGYFQMIRTGRKRWLLGEIMFVIFSAFVMLLLIFAGSAAFTAKDQEPSNVWSPFMTVMRENFPLLYADNHLLFLDTATVAHGTPLSVFLYTFLTMWIYLVITGLLILLGTVIGKRIPTVTAAAALSVTGGAVVRFGGASWLFPMIHTQFGMHYNSLLSTVYFPLWDSLIYLLLLAAVLAALCRHFLDRTVIGGAL